MNAAERLLADNPGLSRRYLVIVFQQPTLGCHRPDFLVVVTAPGADPSQTSWADRAFLLECDGDGFHSTPEQVRADLLREKELRGRTRLEVVRFSGADIDFPLGAVVELLETVAELRIAVQSHPYLWDTGYFDAIRCRLSDAPRFRCCGANTSGNSRLMPDPYDPTGPRGDLIRHERHQAQTDLDDLDAIVAGRAAIRHEVADVRRMRRASDAAWREEEPNGGLMPFDYVLTAAIEQAAARFFARV